MPLTPSPVTAGPRRRSLLAGALGAGGALGLVAGCSDDDGGSDDSERADDAAARKLRAHATRESQALLARYDGTVAAHAGLAGLLRPLRAQTARHTEVLGGKDAARASRTNRSAVPSDAKQALTALAEAERRTADARTKALMDAPPALARLLASLAAAGAAAAYLLAEGEPRGAGDSGGGEDDGKDRGA
ncbi:hypothetical protein [Streptomyces daliensis]|uniref:Lipoprotein n=1 Tax=Streptomyces daliensis TaxID=299421 RepID=A0A8T4J3S3_9ACTN|nr:hypothetical protein [Streptomyces daliensis]